MISRFTDFISDNVLFSTSEKILLAVSGGIDSMMMWHLFEKAGLNYAVIHCNFQLRGTDSDNDEILVRDVADELGVQLFVKRFETAEYAALSGISIEMAARELRYEWFEEVRNSSHCACVATAHHLDDLLETFFINLVRKTGIRGLTGFRPKSGRIIRPMLFTSRKEIEIWAEKWGVKYRTDRTNDDLIFQRNFIRHKTIPDLEQLNPAFRANLADTILHLREAEDFYLHEINRQIKKITLPDPHSNEISIPALLKLPFPKQVLFEWMNRYNFNPVVVDLVFRNLDNSPGKQFYSKTHRLVTDRGKLVITPLPGTEQVIFYISREDIELFSPLHLSLEYFNADNFEIDPDPRVACLDAGLLEFPLIIKSWQPGEYFQPLGMGGFKKISDFFIDQKLSIPEKEQIRILYSGSKVVWIIGQRIDHRFRIGESTQNVLKITLHVE